MSSSDPSSPSDQSASTSDTTRQKLYEIMATDELSLAEKQTEALELGREYLGVENGHIERADEGAGTHEIVASVGGPDDLLSTGATLDRATTYCRRTMESTSPIALANAPEEGWEDDPAYQKHGFDCYLGAPIFVRGDPYGVVCFINENPRDHEFRADEKAFVELVARLLGRELDATNYEADLSEAHRRREALVEAAPDAIFLADASTGELVEVNEAATTLTGYDAATLDAMRVYDLHPTGNRGQYRQLFGKLADSEETTRTLPDGSQLELCTADGDRVPIEMSASVVELGDGRYIQGIVRDTSERVQREQELDRERELFAYSQRLAGVGGWEYDCRTDEMYWTEEVRRIHGVDDEFTPTVEDALSFYHPEDRPRVEAAIDRAVENNEPYDLELRIVSVDDEVRWVRAQGRPARENGEPTRLRGTFQDITERKEREQELRLRTRAMDEAGVGISIADATEPACPLVYVNEAFTEMTGYDEAAVIGENCRFLQGPGTEETSVDVVREAIEHEETRVTELLNYRADGTPFWNELTVTPVADDAGETTHFIGIQREITARKRRERLIGVLNRLLRHNLRNDMTVVAGLGEAIAEASDGEIAAHAETITETAHDLVTISEKAQIVETALRDDPAPRQLDVVEVVEEAVADLRAAHPETRIRTELPGEQRAVATERLRAVLVELVGNAVAAGAETVTVAVGEPDEDASRVSVEVRDDGPGLPASEVRVLQQASETALDHGSSFGLWLVNWLVTEMGGTVDAEVDEGTTVTVALREGHGDDQRHGGGPGQAALGDDPDSLDW